MVYHSDRGFTLIELAIVLVIVGLLVGIGASMVGPLTKRAKYTETKEALQNASQSIIGYAATMGNRLPDAATFPAIIKTSKDAWGKSLSYIFDNALTGSTSICNRTTTNITVRRCNNAACTAPVVITNVAFLVVSSGPNYNNQTGTSQAVAAPTTFNIYEPDVGAVDGCNDPPVGVRLERYDDIVDFVTIYDLKVKSGSVGKELGIVTRFLPNGKVGNLYGSTTVSAVNGTAPYSWSIVAGTLPAGLSLAPTTGVISGTPTTAGAYPVTIRVTDALGYTAQQQFSITVDP